MPPGGAPAVSILLLACWAGSGEVAGAALPRAVHVRVVPADCREPGFSEWCPWRGIAVMPRSAASERWGVEPWSHGA